MSYRVVYEPEKVVTRKGQSQGRIRLMIAVSFGLFAVLVRFLWPAGREVMMQYLLPGQESVAQIAFSELLGNLRQGTAMTDALTVFCKEILYEIA